MSIQEIAKKGRYGDNHLLHVSDAEVQGLNALANSMYGHGLTTNPDTGLPEAFLFAPLLAPMIAGSGATALGVGLTAGALGTAEAAARDMDDPLARGMMAGLTAGAGSAIGSNLGQMGADAAGQTAGQAGLDAASQTALQTTGSITPTPDLSQTLQGAATTAPVSQMPQVGTDALQSGPFNMMNAPAIPSATPPAPGVTTQPSVFNPGAPTNVSAPPTPDTFMGRNLPNFGDVGSVDFMGGTSDMARGAEKAFGSQEGFKQFMDQNQGALIAGTAGIGGTAQLDAMQKQREEAEAMKGRKQAKYDEMVNRIKSNYAAAGRPLPTNPYGPLFGGPQGFKEGGLASLRGKTENFNQATGYAGGGDVAPATREVTLADFVNLSKGNLSVPEGGLTGEGMFGSLLAKLINENRGKFGYATGGYLEGGMAGDGMSDDIPATIDGEQPAALSDGEFVIPADVVSHLGNGSSNAGADQLYSMMDRIRKARTGTKEQAPQVDAGKYLPA